MTLKMNPGAGARGGPLAVARAALQAYVDKDREALQSLIHADYRFTSPLDNALRRETYLALCWPNSANMESVAVIHEVEFGEQALITYEVQMNTGKRFRNSEVHTVREGKLVATEVYFGWDIPHGAAEGQHVDDADA